MPRGLERVPSGLRVVGESAEWREVLRKATQVAPTDTTVLITGESGTGKEVVARFIHAASARKDGPFVALNCAALPEQLLESELFGHERGAFTSAHQAKPGHLELAAGGVLFLDEVGEMSKAGQAKLLRVLQEREFQRVGGTRTLKADIRVVAATNRDLRKAVQRGEFREDLLYRLEVFDIRIPPLRERRADIVPLTDALLRDIAVEFRRPAPGLTRDARDVLLRHDWPGNVRELRNALERAAILAGGGPIQRGSLHPARRRRASGRRLVDGSELDGTRDHPSRPARDALEQVEGGDATRLVADAALRSHAEVLSGYIDGRRSGTLRREPRQAPQSRVLDAGSIRPYHVHWRRRLRLPGRAWLSPELVTAQTPPPQQPHAIGHPRSSPAIRERSVLVGGPRGPTVRPCARVCAIPAQDLAQSHALPAPLDALNQQAKVKQRLADSKRRVLNTPPPT